MHIFNKILKNDETKRNLFHPLKRYLRRNKLYLNDTEILLLHLLKDRNLTHGEIEEELMSTNANYTIAKLANNDYIHNVGSQEDRRCTICSLTHKGKAALTKISQWLDNKEENIT